MDHKTDTDKSRDLDELGFYLEKRGKIWVVQFIQGGCLPASIAEQKLWQALQAGRASLAANAGSEPVKRVFLVHTGEEHEGEATYTRHDDAPPPLCDSECLYTHPSPPEGMVGGLQVYRCKIKSRKQIDREIPREQQGWWADVAAGQKLLLRQAVQSDLDRCTLGGKRSRNPADYMCETHTNGSLVSKVALEYMNPEQNVFAAAPPTLSADSRKGE